MPDTIDKPGFYDIGEKAYHADPCVEPSLSNSIAKTLINQSPRHAMTAHPRLNPDWQATNSMQFDLGKAAHELMLGDGAGIVEVDSDAYRTKDAKTARDAAYADGKIPVLPHQLEEAKAMVAAGKLQLALHADASEAFTDGTPEQVVIWQEGETWCRSMLDWLPDDLSSPVVVYDYKTTATSANPDSWQRHLFDMGYDMQAAFYRRGLRALTRRDLVVDFRFIVQENSPPYALSVIGLTPAGIDMADRKVDAALKSWRWCLANNRWPGYPKRTAYVDPPSWHETRWLEREAREETMGKNINEFLADWYAPHEKQRESA